MVKRMFERQMSLWLLVSGYTLDISICIFELSSSLYTMKPKMLYIQIYSTYHDYLEPVGEIHACNHSILSAYIEGSKLKFSLRYRLNSIPAMGYIVRLW